MDEISTSAQTHVFEITERHVKKYMIDPAQLGFKKAELSSLQSGGPEENAAMIREILSGEKGPKRDIVILNAGVALYVAGIAKDVEQGIALAAESIDSGKAKQALDNLVKEAQRFADNAK